MVVYINVTTSLEGNFSLNCDIYYFLVVRQNGKAIVNSHISGGAGV